MSEPREQEPEVSAQEPDVQVPNEGGALSDGALESVAGGTIWMPPTLPPTDPPPYFPEDPFGPLS